MNNVTVEAKYKDRYDVIVVGGGIAGVAASVAAARGGVSVLLLEKAVNLGGLATGGLISWYEPLCDGEGNKIIGGIAEELIKLSIKYGFDNLSEKWGGSESGEPKNQRYSTNFSPTIFSASLDEYVLASGVTIRFDSLGTNPIMKDGRCVGVVVESVSGSEWFECGMLIDTTGDASVIARAGIPTVAGKNYMSYVAHYYEAEDSDLLKNKDVCRFRKWLGVGSDMYGDGHPEGMKMMYGDTAEAVTEYMIIGKKRLMDRIRQKDRNSFDIMTLPTIPQYRTIRRIVGKTDFNAEDGKTYADSVGACGDFRPKGIGNHYEVPFGALYNENYDNVLTAGRIISAPQGDGWEVARVIPVCALTGEAAGKAAALCVKRKCFLNDLTDEDIKNEVCVK